VNEQEFISLHRGHLTQISRYLIRRCDRSEVEELASQVFEIAWRKKEQAPKGYELAWLYRIAGFVVSNHRRAAQIERNFFNRFRPVDFAPSPEDLAIADLSLAEAWSLLTPLERQTLSLSAFEGLSNQEAAVVLEISPNAFSQRLAKAKNKLKANLS